MSKPGEDLDLDTLERAASEALDRPHPSSMWDERLYITHGVVMSWAERGGDVLDESNYLMVLAELQGVATEGTDETESEDVIDASIGDWLVGSLRQIFVRVRDEAGEFTPVFRAATQFALDLRDYPVFDEGDYSEREYRAELDGWEQYGRGDLRSEMRRHANSPELDDHLTEIVLEWVDELPDSDLDELLEPYRNAGDLDYYDGYWSGLVDVAKELVNVHRAALVASWDEHARSLIPRQDEELPLQLA